MAAELEDLQKTRILVRNICSGDSHQFRQHFFEQTTANSTGYSLPPLITPSESRLPSPVKNALKIPFSARLYFIPQMRCQSNSKKNSKLLVWVYRWVSPVIVLPVVEN